MDKKCQTCARFPFCNSEPKDCINYIKKTYENSMKLVSKNGLNFKFEEVHSERK